MKLTSELILEGNMFIAKFMGWQKSIYENLPNKMYKENYTIGIHINQLSYHSDWNMLMEVVEKIEGIGGFVRIEKTEIIVHHSGIKDINLGCVSHIINNGKVLTSQEKLEGVWLGIVNFLKEYNQKLNISL